MMRHAFGVIYRSGYPHAAERIIRDLAAEKNLQLNDVFTPPVCRADLAIWLLDKANQTNITTMVFARAGILATPERIVLLSHGIELIDPGRPCTDTVP